MQVCPVIKAAGFILLCQSEAKLWTSGGEGWLNEGCAVEESAPKNAAYLEQEKLEGGRAQMEAGGRP